MPKQVDNVNRKSLPLAEKAFELIHAVMHLHRAQQLRSLRDGAQELTHMESKAMGYFARHPGATQSELVAHSRRDKAQIARLIASLRERSLLEAHIDESDRRNQRLELTATGQRLHDTLQQQGRKLARLGMSALNAEEGRQLVSLLEKVQQSLAAESDSASA